jgi:hypothetical protein
MASVAVPPGVVWLASYPKSGNTWLRILLSNLLGDGPQDINDLSLKDSIASDRLDFDNRTLLDSLLLRDDEVERLRPAVHDACCAERRGAGFVKVHDAYTRLADGAPLLGRGARAALYMVRDPRDVAVSNAFHNDCSLDAAIGDLGNPTHALQGGRYRHRQVRQRLLDWSGHVASWLDQRELPVYLIRYEDLLADTAAVFGQALVAIGIAATADRIAAAVRHADFAELQRQERQADFIERVGGAPFFRQGRAGGWRECLTPEQVGAIEAAHGVIMERLGYRREGTG